MSSSFEKSVKGATKIKAAPPKSKYIEHILVATHSGEHGVAEVFRSLQNRLRDSTWTVVFKSLITVHLMIREGTQDATLEFLSKHRNMLAVSSFSDAQTQGTNIRHYSEYLTERGRAFRETKCDWVRGADSRLQKLTVEKGLLRETEIVQRQITQLLKCDVLDTEPENEVTITVFRLLVLDLLALYHNLNQSLINILGHFFEMSRSDAERAMGIYRNFTTQTDFVVAYLATARQYQHSTRVEVPKLKHAPIHLGKSLEDYLADPDFEINRRQYLAELEAKRSGKPTAVHSKPFGAVNEESRVAVGNSFPDAVSSQQKSAPQAVNAPSTDLIDFFDSIEQNQQPIASQSVTQGAVPTYNGVPPYQIQQQFPQATGFQDLNQFQQQSFNPFGQPQQQQQPQTQPQIQPLQPNFTGAGFGGYTPQPSFQPGALSSIPQESSASFPNQSTGGFQSQGLQPQQTTNPFRLSMMAASNTGMQSYPLSPPNSAAIQPQNTNPFAKSTSPPQTQPFSPPPEQQFHPQPQSYQAPAPLQPMATGTNPFAKNYGTPPPPQQQTQPTGLLVPQQTGSTNPFRQSQFVNTATGMGWQNNQGAIGGGLDHLETVPVFPRPAQQQAWQQ